MRSPARPLLPLRVPLLLLLLAACGPDAPVEPPVDEGRVPDTFLPDNGGEPFETVNTGDARFSFYADPRDSAFECSLDGSTYTSCAVPQLYSGLADGPHTFQVRAVLHGVMDPTPASRTWSVDTTPPDTSVTEAPSGTVTSNDLTFAFLSTEAGGFQCSLDDGAWAGCTSPHRYAGLTEGPHTLRVRAQDPVLNLDPSPAEVRWSVDTREPETLISAGPAEGSTASTNSVSFAFESSEEGSTFECALDGEPFSGCENPKRYEALGDGWHVFEVRARDAVLNTDVIPARRRWLVDTGTPQARITSGPSGVTNSIGGSFEFDASGVAATFECALDGAAFSACTSPRSYPTPEDREYRFQVRAVSLAGVAGTPAVRTWTLDTTAPETTISEGPVEGGTSTTRSASFSFTSSEPNSTFECSLDGEDYAACSSPKVYEGLSNASHRFLVKARDALANTDVTPASRTWTVAVPALTPVRLVAANLTSGNNQSYDPGHGARILQGVQPDVVMIQEFNYGDNSTSAIRGWVTNTFGASFQYFRETGAQIPNGIISRWPILASGEWTDTQVSNRDFSWARIDLPGSKDLWVVSVHLLTSGSTVRNTEATNLVAYIKANVPAGDYLAIGGDFNTDSRTESCLSTFSQVVVTSGPHPVDKNGKDGTNAGRTKPYDHVLVDADLKAYQTATVLGASTFASGLVVDTRVYSPIEEILPALSSDSGATNMQHMAVVKDFLVPAE